MGFGTSWKFIGGTIKINGAELKQIVSLIEVEDQNRKLGTLGGFIKPSTELLDTSWVEFNSTVYDSSTIKGHSLIKNGGSVCDNSIITNSIIDSSKISNNSLVDSSNVIQSLVSGSAVTKSTIANCWVLKNCVIDHCTLRKCTLDKEVTLNRIVKDHLNIWGTIEIDFEDKILSVTSLESPSTLTLVKKPIGLFCSFDRIGTVSPTDFLKYASQFEAGDYEFYEEFIKIAIKRFNT